MPTIKAQLFNFLLRNRHVINGKFRKEIYDDNTSIQDFRDLCEKGATRFAKIPEGISVESANIEGMRSEWLIPTGSSVEKMVMYVHGGGYVSGSCNDHRAIVSKFAESAGVKFLVYEYRLAPEYPFPAAVDDSIKVYRWLLDSGYKSENILIAGESAGGGLCLALLLALKDLHIDMPVAAVSISPWTDLTCSGDSYRTKNKRSLAPMNSWFVFSKHYTAGSDPKNPLISPLFGDLEGLPPLFINSGTDDELFDDGERFASRAKSAGVDVTFVKGEGMVHCYPLLSPFFREAEDAMGDIIGFMKRYLRVTG